MTRKVSAILILLIMFLHPASVGAKISPLVEIIDPGQKIVVKSVKVNSELYDMAKSWVIDIDNYCGKIGPAAVEGYKVRIPLDPPIKVNKKSLTSEVSEVYIVVPQDKPPFLMIFEGKNKPSYFKFHGNIDSLSKALDFKLRN